MTKIELKRGFIVLIDDEDYKKVKNYTWFAQKSKYTHYVVTFDIGFSRMHRFILGITDPKIKIDHIDHNGLNNQKDNLRICTQSQNNRNKKASGLSKYLGVTKWNGTIKYTKKSGIISEYKVERWRARIKYNGKEKLIGYFKKEKEAAKAYDDFAKKHIGQFANLNFKKWKFGNVEKVSYIHRKWVYETF